MAGNLTISVPATCTARYLVPTDLSEPQARSLALTTVDAYASGPMRRWMHEVIDTPAVAFAATSANNWPGRTPRQRELLRHADQWMSIQVVAPTGIPWQEWVARSLAGSMARELEAPVADIQIPRLLTADAVLASLYEKENGILRMCDWVSIAAVETRQGVILKTLGMWRYGLPEIEVTHVPPGLARQCCALLTGVAFRFRAEFAEVVGAATPATEVLPGKAPAKVRLPAEIKVNADDVGTAYCLPGSIGSRPAGRGGGRRKRPSVSFPLVGKTTPCRSIRRMDGKGRYASSSSPCAMA